jgi:glycine/D-amino acid oxidase-like deaminating enzyme
MTPDRGILFWLDRGPMISFDRVSNDMSVDVAIIGGGIVGLHAAYQLRASGLRVAIFEARRIGRQATGRSTAKVTSQQGLKYASLIRDFGKDSARLYAVANQNAVKSIARLCTAMPGAAGLEEKSANIYAEDEKQADRLRDEADAATSLDLPSEFLTNAGLSFETTGALRFHGQYQFDPYLYLCGLANQVAGDNISIFEDSRVVEIGQGQPHILTVNGCSVTAETVIVATQLPVVSESLFFTKAFPFAHPVAAAPLPENVNVDGMYISAGNPSHSFRTAMEGDAAYLVAAGGEFKTGEQGAAEKAIDDLLAFLEQKFGLWEPTHLWINEDFRSMDGVALVGPTSSAQPDLLVAAGFDAWGITQATVAGEILAARILGDVAPGEGGVIRQSSISETRDPSSRSPMRCVAVFTFSETNRIKPVAGGPTATGSEEIEGRHHYGPFRHLHSSWLRRRLEPSRSNVGLLMSRLAFR